MAKAPDNSFTRFSFTWLNRDRNIDAGGYLGRFVGVPSAMPAHRFHGLELPVRSCSGARSIRVVHEPHQRIEEHRHDWPLITIPRLGGYQDMGDEGAFDVDGPALILHPAGRYHANCIHSTGMETFSIEFDPSWLGLDRPFDRSFCWQSGPATASARALVSLWSDPQACETDLRRATASIVARAIEHRRHPKPRWFEKARYLALEAELPTKAVAQELELHADWFARAYRNIAGEGVRETIRRRMLERAVEQLRNSDLGIVEIALEAGFCDQSHLNRAMKAYIGRTPHQIREERRLLQSGARQVVA